MKTCSSLRDTCCTFRNYVKDGSNSRVISQDSFVVIYNRAESTKHSFIRTLVLVSSVRFASLEILWIIEIVRVLQNQRRKITAQKPVWILYKHFHAHKIISDLFGFSPVSPICWIWYHILHALGMNCIPRIRNKLFTDVLIAIVSKFLWKPIRSILLIKVWNTLKVPIQCLNIQKDKWMKWILSSKPSLPKYNSVSGGSRLPQHWWVP